MFAIVDSESDSYKAKTLAMLLASGTPMSDDDLARILNNTSDSYKTQIARACINYIAFISECNFQRMINAMSDSYKTSFAVTCVHKAVITEASLRRLLSEMSDSYKTAFASACLPSMGSLEGDSLYSILSGMSDSYKAGFISACYSNLSTLSDEFLLLIMGDVCDSYKAHIIRALALKIAISPATQLAILKETSSSYHRNIIAVLQPRVVAHVIAIGSGSRATASNAIAIGQSAVVARDRSGNFSAATITNHISTLGDIVGDVSPVPTALQTQDEWEEWKEPVKPTPIEDEGKNCVVCLESQANGVFVPCGHKVCCMECGAKLTSCPTCRAPKQMFIKVFEG